jgi:hypothetical protein
MPVQIITHTIKSAGGDYTTLSAWESAQQRDLTSGSAISGTITGTDGQIEKAECYEMDLSGTVTINGWTTTASNYVWVMTPTGERHSGITVGTATGGGFHIRNGGNVFGFHPNHYGVIEGIYVECTATAVGSDRNTFHNLTTGTTTNGNWLFKNNLSVNRNIVSTTQFSTALFRGTLVNNFFITAAADGLSVHGATSAKVINNTVLFNGSTATTSSRGFLFGVGVSIWNNYVGNFSSDFVNVGTGSASSFGYNASRDTSATARFGTTSLSNMLPTEQFLVIGAVGATNIDLHLSASSGLIDAGSSTTTATLDIDGDSRS